MTNPFDVLDQEPTPTVEPVTQPTPTARPVVSPEPAVATREVAAEATSSNPWDVLDEEDTTETDETDESDDSIEDEVADVVDEKLTTVSSGALSARDKVINFYDQMSVHTGFTNPRTINAYLITDFLLRSDIHEWLAKLDIPATDWEEIKPYVNVLAGVATGAFEFVGDNLDLLGFAALHWGPGVLNKLTGNKGMTAAEAFLNKTNPEFAAFQKEYNRPKNIFEKIGRSKFGKIGGAVGKRLWIPYLIYKFWPEFRGTLYGLLGTSPKADELKRLDALASPGGYVDWDPENPQDPLTLDPWQAPKLARGGPVLDPKTQFYLKSGGKVGNKIKLLMDEGKPQKQAVAIALDMNRRGELANYKAKGGSVDRRRRRQDPHGRYKDRIKSYSVRDFLEFVPIVGDILGAEEIYQELRKDPINWALIGALGGATIIGMFPGIGDAAAVAIKKGARAGLKGVKGGSQVAKKLKVDPEVKPKKVDNEFADEDLPAPFKPRAEDPLDTSDRFSVPNLAERAQAHGYGGIFKDAKISNRGVDKVKEDIWDFRGEGQDIIRARQAKIDKEIENTRWLTESEKQQLFDTDFDSMEELLARLDEMKPKKKKKRGRKR